MLICISRVLSFFVAMVVLLMACRLNFASTMRFLCRYSEKLRRYRQSNHKKPTELEPNYPTHLNDFRLRTYPESKGEGPTGSVSKQPDLAYILFLHPVFSLVTRNVHYVDMMNLTLVSRSVRNAVHQSLNPAPYTLRRNTCANGTRYDCWSCGNQICNVSIRCGLVHCRY